jgi:hypothetical protein
MPFVLTIGERGHSWAGRPPAVSVYATREEAERDLNQYVRENWDSEMGIDKPDDESEMVEQYYFSDVLERYEINEVTRPRATLITPAP